MFVGVPGKVSGTRGGASGARRRLLLLLFFAPSCCEAPLPSQRYEPNATPRPNRRRQLYAKSTDRNAVLYTVRVQTPPTATRLVAPEKTALAQLVADCCDVRYAMQVGASNVQLCATV